MRIECPYCGRMLKGEEGLVGSQARCPNCKSVFTVQPTIADEAAGEEGKDLGGEPTYAPIEDHGAWDDPAETKMCPFCGETVLASAKKCKHCLEWLDESARPMLRRGEDAGYRPRELRYAGFWPRFGAVLIDMMVLVVAGFVFGFAVGLFAVALGVTDRDVLERIGNVAGILVNWIYYAAMESSPTQATLGKMALGIQVTDLNGRRIGFARATGRHFAKIVSSLILLMGFIMVAFTEKKQGLHDMIAGCLVVRRP